MVLKKIPHKVVQAFCFFFACLLVVLFALNLNIQSHAYTYKGFKSNSPIGTPELSFMTQYSDWVTMDLPATALSEETGLNPNEFEKVVFDEFGQTLANVKILDDGINLQYNIRFNETNIGLITNSVSISMESPFILPAGSHQLVLASFSERYPSVYGVIEYVEQVINEQGDYVTTSYLPRTEFIQLGSISDDVFSYTFTCENTVVVTNFQMTCDIYSPTDHLFVVVPKASPSSDVCEALAYWNDSVQQTIFTTDFPTNWLDWLGDVVSGFFNIEFAPGFTFGGLFMAICGILLFMYFIHVFKG